MRFGRHRRSARRSGPGWVAALGLALLATVARGEDEPGSKPPAVPEPALLATIVSDPGGEASAIAHEALVALAADDSEGAYDRLVKLAEEHGDVLVPVSLFAGRARGRADGALRWPARIVANHALAALPAELRERLDDRWSPRTLPLWQRVRRGDDEALDRLAARFPATNRGSRALLLVAERELEAGRRIDAARVLKRWLDLNPEAPDRARATVVIRLADALAGLEDAGALEALQVLYRDLRSVSVTAGGAATNLGERMAAWRASRSKRPEPAAAPAAAALDLSKTATPVLLWTRPLTDPGLLLADRRSRGELSVRAGAWGQGNTLVLHEGRTVRRLDLCSGLERWRFPRVDLATVHDPRERYATYDLPYRSVTPAAGGRLLAVLGDPAAAGRYSFLSQEFDADELGQECRPRLVCLEIETGKLLWTTGAADETHPVLGDGATGCASPPLVVGDRVYCLFARTLGAAAFYAASLDLATGKAHWVGPLASGESGRSDDRAGAQDRFTGTYVQSVPWGARPTLSDGEVCVVPHAGLAAGVDERDGSVRWLRALPRFSRDAPMPANRGHTVRNAPVPWGDAWLLAPMDCPHLVCLAHGTGDLRWQRGTASGDAPEWRDLLGVSRDAKGRPRILLSGLRPLTMDPADGSVQAGDHLEAWEAFDGEAAGVALDLDDHVLYLGAGSLQSQRWEPDAADAGAPPVAHLLEETGVPTDGDLYRVGDVLVAIGLEHPAAVMAPPAAWSSRLAEAGLDAAGSAAQDGLRAMLERDPALFARALERARGVKSAPVRARLEALLGAQLERAVADLEGRDASEELADADVEAWVAVAEQAPVGRAGVSLRRLAQLLLDRSQDERAARLLVRWIERADDTLIDAGDTPGVTGGLALPEGRIRGDLIAGAMLRRHAGRPALRAVLAEREKTAEREVGRVLDGSEAAVRTAIRRYAGTRAADTARGHLIAVLTEAGRFADAAALIADRRLDAPWLDLDREAGERLLAAARLQLEETERLDDAGDSLRARTLVADLERWVPGGTQSPAGRTTTVLSDALDARYGWYPLRGQRGPELDIWRDHEEPENRDALRSVEFLGLTGPGADKHRQTVVLVRGLAVEVWSLHARKRLAVLHGGDEGWFGGSLTSIDRWVPGGGIRVTSIVAGEPADASGVQAGDWVRSWNGRPVYDLPTFMNLVASSEPGVEIPVSIRRGGREVMDRFAAGRRPPEQGRMLDYGDVYADAEGRLLIPGRTGLTWVDARAGTRTAFWTWREPGVLRRTFVLDGRAYVTVQCGLQPDVVVAVDLAAGREIWRRNVHGSVTRVEAVGSGIWVEALSPSHVVLLDRHDGRPRGDYRCFDFHRHEFRKNWTEAPASAVAAGRGYVVNGSRGLHGGHALHVVNTTTGRVEHAESWIPNPDRRASPRYYVNPQIAAGAFVAVVRPPGLRLFLPDPLGGSPLRRVDIDPKLLMANQGHYGRLDQDARVFIRGDTLYLLRVPIQGRQNVNLCVFGVTFKELGSGSTIDLVSGGDGFYMRTKRSWMQGSALPTRYVLDARPRFEGIFVSAARLAGDHRRESWWISALHEDRDADNLDVRFVSDDVQEARRPVPVRVGKRLLVATDRGAKIFDIARSGR